MNVTLRQLRAFVEVVRTGGFTAAARKLHLTQSAVSLLVRELEGALRLKLIDRTTKRIAVTDAGGEFLLGAERILGDVEQAIANAQDLLQKRRGRVVVAATPLLAATLLPEVIAQFQHAYPEITVQLADLQTEQIVKLVQGADADFGVGVFPEPELDVDRVELLRHRLGVMVPSAWPLARRRRNLTWADLADQPMIAMSRGSGFGMLIDPLLHQAGIPIKPRFVVAYLATAVGLAEAGLGITVVPAYVGALLRSRRARFRVLYNPVVTRQVELITRPGRSLSPGAAAFRDELAARCKRLQG
ncbi:MAG: LysR family transcriptional regulator [Burkholderiales bacterium]|nr:LysR family transcriptional regulator [Burkholderiales bacterium]